MGIFPGWDCCVPQIPTQISFELWSFCQIFSSFLSYVLGRCSTSSFKGVCLPTRCLSSSVSSVQVGSAARQTLWGTQLLELHPKPSKSKVPEQWGAHILLMNNYLSLPSSTPSSLSYASGSIFVIKSILIGVPTPVQLSMV